VKYKDIYPDSPYLKSIEIFGEPVVTVITGAKKEKIIDASRPDSEEVELVVYCHGIKKFICNKTNFKTISLIAGIAETDKWIGTVITLYAKKGTYFGIEGTAIRVMPKPEPLALFLKQSTSLEDLKERYKLINQRGDKNLVTELINKLK